MSLETTLQPALSVIIPTYNRKDSLLRALNSVARQTYPAERFEVIVVDDGGSDGTVTIAQQPFPFALRYLRQQNQGEIVARNLGANECNGEILVFLDDDIEINRYYLAALASVHAVHAKAVVLGTLIEFSPEHLGEQLRIRQQQVSKSAPAADPEAVTFIECMSGIVSLSRKGFFAIGAMQPLRSDERRNIWGGIDLGYRAHQNGFTLWRAANAVALHHDNNMVSLETCCRRHYKVSYAVHDLFAKYPALDGQIPMFSDKGPIRWRHDPPRIIARKMARQVASSNPALWAMERSVKTLDRSAPQSRLLALFYRWIVSGYIYRGYRDGLREFSRSKT